MPPQRPPTARLRPAAFLLAPLLVLVVVGFIYNTRSANTPFNTHSASVPIATAEAQPLAQPLPAISLWASKRNPLNMYFAKLAWAWTTALFVAALPLRNGSRPAAATARYAARYVLATLYWFLMTQWCFGPSLFDRFFRLAPSSMQVCRSAGGRWLGGHDISGHCFLLIHSALFLFEEVLGPCCYARWGVVAATAGLIAIWACMLYCTAKYFHGPWELISGTLLGSAYWVSLYQFQLLAF
ncbi:inositol phospholipid synthesis and fat-storage-inducing TM-domain-containing protein [Kickxella alabastrina]|uniref:inositol phospholipid synthesis and fat-storage-inducing TM-domain-containing protein n=1 Tax=Kickxella alabastrina TaxID=61397 RepID=UPI00221FA5A3|nr:inositol phospholipid synthesis and fat-storage-inducing TM-domain-containing protein [Kickxella alabastrina]KAI7833864.1 inositol phospholipid synthesis and fat-storage-inducing TM-domain-containing protein [Kickxella alabastrina]